MDLFKETKETLHKFWNSERQAVHEDVATNKVRSNIILSIWNMLTSDTAVKALLTDLFKTLLDNFKQAEVMPLAVDMATCQDHITYI